MPDATAKKMVAIAAAVQAYLEEEGRGRERRPPRPVVTTTAWADYGRAELMRLRTNWQLRLAR